MTFANTKYKNSIYSLFPSKKIFFYLKLIEKYISIQREIMTNYKYNTNISSTDYEKIIKELYDKIYICIIIIIKRFKPLLDILRIKLDTILYTWRSYKNKSIKPFNGKLNNSFKNLLNSVYNNKGNNKGNNKNQKLYQLQNLNINVNSKYISKKKFMGFYIPRMLNSTGKIKQSPEIIKEIDISKEINKKIYNNISFLIGKGLNYIDSKNDVLVTNLVSFYSIFLDKLNNIVCLIKEDGYTIDIDYKNVQNYVFT
jgi:hypothetical protein